MTGTPISIDDVPAPVCHCTAQQVVKRKFSNGAVHFVSQCQVCGRQVGGAISLANVRRLIIDENLAPPWDEGIAKRWEQTMGEWRGQVRKQALLDASITGYNEYLESPEWQQKRQLVFTRSGGMCEGCGLDQATQVHHLSYDHIGDELLFELVAVCDGCHDKAHNPSSNVTNPWLQ